MEDSAAPPHRRTAAPPHRTAPHAPPPYREDVIRRLALAAALLLAITACSGHPKPTVTAIPTGTPSTSPIPAASPTLASPSPSPSAAPAAPTSPSASPALAFCSTGQLRLSLTQSDSGAGQAHQRLVLTNSGARCSLRGYPGVSFVDPAGRLLGSPAAMSAGPVRQVLLANSGTASAVLTYSNAGAYPDSTCRPREADRVRVYPPGQRTALLAKDPVLVCAAPGSGQLHIGPMEP